MLSLNIAKHTVYMIFPYIDKKGKIRNNNLII